MTTSVSTLLVLASLALSVGLAPVASAAAPPELINYQGVLRDPSGAPVADGAYDFVFRFYGQDAPGGTLFLTDSHAGALAITTRSGMFNTSLGGGTLTAGTYASLGAMFAGEPVIFLDVQVGTDPSMTPRTRIVAAGYALNAGRLDGRAATEYLDTSSSSQVKLRGQVIVRNPDTDCWSEFILGGDCGAGLRAASSQFGHEFYGPGGRAWIGSTSYGVEAWTTGGAAGYFHQELMGSGVHLATTDYGVDASAPSGGHFSSQWTDAEAWLARNHRGVEAQGYEAGGYLRDTDGSGYAYVGYGNLGIEGRGSDAGAFFSTTDGRNQAYVGSRHSAEYGVEAYGRAAGGYFQNPQSGGEAKLGGGSGTSDGFGAAFKGATISGNTKGVAKIAYRDGADGSAWGAYGAGKSSIGGTNEKCAGGRFRDLDINPRVTAYVAYWDGVSKNFGVWSDGPGHFQRGSDWVEMPGTGGYKLSSNLANAGFVQNHPTAENAAIVYTAPEGNEVATYTRGTARLESGAARVSLDETFALVTNPDIGLTVHVTPRESWSDLYVESATTAELVVRSAGGAPGAVFDYLVYGVRIGFEDVAVVHEKYLDAPIPDLTYHRDLLERRPEWRRFTARERFGAMRASIGEAAQPDMARSQALIAAIGVSAPPAPLSVPETAPTPAEEHTAGLGPAVAVPAAAPAPVDERPSEADGPAIATVPLNAMPVSEAVGTGDLLTLDPVRPGQLMRASVPNDPGVVGVATGPSELVDGTLQAPVAVYGIATIRADASLGAIQAGDLLAASALPGCAVRASNAAPGTVVGKALEPLDAGTALIKVLVMPR